MYDDAIQAEVDHLAQRLRRSVLVNDPMVRNLYRSVHFGDEDPLRIRALLQRDTGADVVNYVLSQGVPTWTAPGRIPANPPLGMTHPRVCMPIRRRGRADGEMIGMIMMVDPGGSLTDIELDHISRSSEALAPLLDALTSSQRGQKAVWDLVSADSEVRDKVVRDLREELPFEYVCAVRLTLRSDRPALESTQAAHAQVAFNEALGLHTGQHAGGKLYSLSESQAIVLLGSNELPANEQLAAEISRVLRRFEGVSPDGFSLTAGFGSVVRGLESAHLSARHAAVALRGTQQHDMSTESMIFWNELGPLAILLQVPREDLLRSSLPDEVQRLLQAVPYEELLCTVRIYLDHGGNGPAAAEALHIHRTTLYYRIGRVAELTGLDLADGRTRLTLHLGLTMLELLPDTDP